MANFILDENGKIVRKKKKTNSFIKDDADGAIRRMIDDIKPFEKELDEELAPTKNTLPNTSQEEKRTWFDTGAFDDGYQFGDLLKTVSGTAKDIRENLITGVLGIGEGVVDAGATVAGGVGSLFGKDEFAEKMKGFVKKELVDEEKVAKTIVNYTSSPFGDPTRKNWGFNEDPFNEEHNLNTDDISLSGERLDSLTQSGGQLLGTGLLSQAKIPWYLVTGLTSFGGQAEEAFNNDASYGEAVGSALVSAGAEILTEKLFGGSGLGEKGLINVDGLTKGISNKVVKTLVDYGIDIAAEGTEEVFSQFFSNLGTSLYRLDDESLGEILFSEEAFDGYLESFIGGAALGGFANVGKAVNSIKTGRDYRTELTTSEQAVVDKELEKRISEAQKSGKILSEKDRNALIEEILKDMGRGAISIDTIEEALGGDTYKSYQNAVKSKESLLSEYEELGKKTNPTLADQARYNELRDQVKTLDQYKLDEELKTKLSEEVKNKVTSGRDALIESYNEDARRKQPFTVDLSKIDPKYHETYKRAMESGVIHNGYRAHELVDTIAKIEADKGIVFKLSNTEKLKEAGHYYEGQTINGVYDSDGSIILNVKSPTAWQFTVGHEVTHALEKSGHYGELRKLLYEYAEMRGEYKTRFDSIENRYKGKTKDFDSELTADLVGDYLFTDENFVNHLSKKNRNIFQKIYDEIKYLFKVATAGSKEARQIEKIKREFDRAYNENIKRKSEADVDTDVNTDVEIDDVQYSVSVTDKETLDSLNSQVEKGEYNAETNPDGGYYVTYKSMSFWGYDKNGNAILRSPMAEYVDGELSNAYLIPADKSKLNWYKSTETIDEATGLPSGLLVKVKKPGNKSYSYLPAATNQDLIAEDWSNLYFNLKKKVQKKGKWVDSDVPARYNPYEHSSNSMLNDQFSTAYLRDNLVTVKMYVPVSEDNGTFRAQYSKDPTGWTDWKTGTVAGKINKQKDLQRRVFLSRYAAPVEIVSDAEVAQAYKGYLEGTDVAIPDNVVSPGLLDELKKAGVKIKESGKVRYSISQDSEGNKLTNEQSIYFKDSKVRDENGSLKVMYHGSTNGGFHEFDADFSDDGRSLFFVDNARVAESYSGTGETYAARRFNTAEDFNSFFAEIGANDYEVKYENGWFDLYEDGVSVAQAETAKMLYEEWRDWTGLGEGAVNYKVYLDIKNPLELDAEGRMWNELPPLDENAEVYDYIKVVNVGDTRGQVTIEYAMNFDPAPAIETVDLFEKFSYGLADRLSGLAPGESIENIPVKETTTRDYAEYAKANGYDGVILKNILDIGAYGGTNAPSTVAIAFESNQVKSVANAQPTGDSDIRYSLSDSDGNQLSEQQKEFFKDSKAVDANGNLKLVYHGTRNADFTVFKRNINYFTDSKEMADSYAPNGAMYEGYVNITKPFEIDAQGEKWSRVPIDDATKDFLERYGVSVFKEGGKWRTSPADIASAIEEAVDNGDFDYDGIIIKNIDDTGRYWKDKDNHLATDYIVFNSNQFKNFDNLNPTDNADIRFSLSEPVEQARDLFAMHNLTADKLAASLKLGGFPSPSIAITKKDIVHDNYGGYTVLLNKSAIDPEADSRNKVYGSDAWTPTSSNARTEYEVDWDTMRALEKKLQELGKQTANGAFVSESLIRRMGIEDATDQNAARIAERLANTDEVRAAYLASMGQNIEPEYKTKVYNKAGNKALQTYIEKVGAQRLAAAVANIQLGNAEVVEADTETARQILRDNFIEEHAATLNRKPEIKDIRINRYMERNVTPLAVEDFINDAWEYYQEGGAVTEEIDRLATSDKLRQAVNDSEVRAWLEPQIAEFLGEPAIRNNLDPFDRYGRSRSFAELHYPYTAENIVKAMQGSSSRGVGAGVNANSIIATATPSYKSINEIRQDSGRLNIEDQYSYDEILNGIDKELKDISHDITLTTKHHTDNQFDEEQIIGSIIVESATGARTAAAIQRAFAKEDYRISTAQAEQILSLYNKAANVPTGYFEAKPERVVGFDEVAAVIIPNNADVKLKQELLNKGFNIAEYDPAIEGDRHRVVNQFEDYMFSLSDIGETPTYKGSYATPLRDLMLETAPMPEGEKAPEALTQTVDRATEADMFPDDYAPMTEEEAAAMQNETLESLTDADAPPEVEVYDDVLPSPLKTDFKATRDIVNKLDKEYFFDKDQRAKAGELVQQYSSAEVPNIAKLTQDVEQYLGEIYETVRNEEIADVKKHLRTYRLQVSKHIQNEFSNYGALQRSLFGKLRIAKDGVPVDVAWMEFAGQFPGFFPNDILSPTDQFNHIVELVNTPVEEEISYKRSDEDISKMVADIMSEVEKYKQDELLRAANKAGVTIFEVADDIAPIVEEAPKATEQTAEVTEETSDEIKPIMTVRERLEAKKKALVTELASNQKLKAQSQTDYNAEIARLKTEYNGKQNKTTKAANAILRRIERMRRMQSVVDAEYEKRINGLNSRIDKVNKEIDTGKSASEEAAMRRDVHTSMVDNIKMTFAESGFDFDKVLKNAKDLSTLSTVDNTPQRVMEKALGYKEGQILSDLTVNKVAENETEAIRWLNSYTDRKNGILAGISKQYNIKPRSKQSAAAQMYAEGFYVDKNNNIVKYGDEELAKDFPNALERTNIKGLANDPIIRQIYDDTLAKINESRARNAYAEIPRLDNYYLHFRAMNDTFSRLGIPFNPNDIRAKDLPTDLNGVTADLKPGQPYFASAQHRTGMRTDFDLLGGLEQYLTNAKNQIFHIDDIQTLRALRNYIADTYGQANGLEGLDALTEVEAEERIKQVYGSHLSTFAKFLNEEANILAGKTALIDRGLEGIIGRRGITFLNTVNRQVGANMVGFNISSSLTNLLAPVQALAKSNKAAFVKAFGQTVANRVGHLVGRGDTFTEDSSVMVRRKGADRFSRTVWDKTSDAGYALMGAIDSFSTELIARTKYNEYIKQGMDSAEAHLAADKWTSRLMGDRSIGQMPQLYNSKMLGIITKFQLEVRNQLDAMFYDTIQDAKVSTEEIQNAAERNAKTAAKVASTFTQLALAQHIFGQVFKSIAGYNPAFDIIEVIAKAFGLDDEEESEDTALDNVEQAFLALLEDLPYTSALTGGRIPLESALPVEELIKGKDDYGNDKSRLDTLKEAAPYYILPGGYGQIKKSFSGLSMFDDEHPVSGSYTDSGNLRFPVEDTLEEMFRAGIFGQWANDNARDYFDRDRKPLNEKQTYEYKDSGMSIQEYWKFQDILSGIAEKMSEGTATDDEALNYKFFNSIRDDASELYSEIEKIKESNLSDKQKEKYIGELRSAISELNKQGFESYGNIEYNEFIGDRYAVVGDRYFKWHIPEEDEEGESGEPYWKKLDEEETAKYKATSAAKDSNYATDGTNHYRLYQPDDPSKPAEWRKITDKELEKQNLYTKAIGYEPSEYWEYKSRLDDIKAGDKTKEKKAEYIDSLNLEIGQKLVLFKFLYPKDDTYNVDIINYLNSRSDITFEEEVVILTELGFKVYEDGRVVWD